MDKYDEQINRIKAATDPHQAIQEEWGNSKGLFAMVAGSNSGCLTMIRNRSELANGVTGRPDLTSEIERDERLPCKPQYITVDHLPVFAEWQRRLDRELMRHV